MFVRSVLVIVMLALTCCMYASAQTAPAAAAPQTAKPEIRHVPATYTSPSSGKAMYEAYCASCHGLDGKGDGPAAPALKMTATNLTTLSVKNGGIFPAAHVAAEIQGGATTPAHGSKEMPVWGPIFMTLSGHSAAQTQLRIRNLTNYLESIQVK
ncbi:MAG TPA: cytochrome c [Candidatus Eisenbacteria bacterium]|nr:cytochrome c [Candidatus Eisenbacteria bacterium]